jgi:hypothetical protein
MFLECRHIKPNGLRCQSPALRGGAFCYFHARLYNHITGEELPIHRIDVPDLSDAAHIHSAIRQTLNAYFSSRLNRKNAGLMLYALQIAAENLDHCSPPPAKKAAQPVAPPTPPRRSPA